MTATLPSSVGTRIWLDEGERKIVVQRQQDVEPVLELNKALQTLGDGYSRSGNLRRVGSIPLVVIEQWLREGFDAFDPNNRVELRRRLNDPEWRHLRTAPGRV